MSSTQEPSRTAHLAEITDPVTGDLTTLRADSAPALEEALDQYLDGAYEPS